MKVSSFFASVALCLSAVTAIANDGGVVAIKVNEIKMRENKWKDGEEVLVRKIAKPNFKITFSGGDAKKLQEVLPSEITVLKAMYPEIAEEYDKTFKTLGIYSDAKNGVTSKVITISCNDGELKFSQNEGEAPKIVKAKETSCTVSINWDENGNAGEWLGDVGTWEPVCK